MSNEVAIRPQVLTGEIIDKVPIFDTNQFNHMKAVAAEMAVATVIPKHLIVEVRGERNVPATAGNMLMVVNQARAWKMDPYAVAQCMSLVHGKPCYEGKLIAAVIDTLLGIELNYEWQGEEGSLDRKIIITHPTQPHKRVAGTVKDWKTEQWGKPSDYDSRLKYRGDRQWCRMWAPSIMLGVYGDDEIDMMLLDAAARRLGDAGTIQRLQAGQGNGKGFNQDHIRDEISSAGGQQAQPADTPAEEQSTDKPAEQQENQQQQEQPETGEQKVEETQTDEKQPETGEQKVETVDGKDPILLTRELFDGYNAALKRASTKPTLGTFKKDFWKDKARPNVKADTEKLTTLFQLHEKRVTGEIKDEYFAAEIEKIRPAE